MTKPNKLTMWARGHKPFVIGMVIVAFVTVLLLATSSSRNKPTTPERRITLIEAACDMLRDGDSPDFVYGVIEDVADDHPYTYPDSKLAARVAVDQAQSQGCG